MQYCPKCRIKVRGDKACCPLCRGTLTGEGDPDTAAFPAADAGGVSRYSLIRIVTFVCVAFAAVVALIEIITRGNAGWGFIAVLWTAVAWADFMVTMFYRNNVIRVVTIELYAAIIICYIIDRIMHYYGWSVAFVIPAAFLALVISTIAIGKGSGRLLGEYILYLAVDMLLSLFQLIPVMDGNNPHPLFAILVLGVMVVLACGAVVFKGRDIRTSLSKTFNM